AIDRGDVVAGGLELRAERLGVRAGVGDFPPGRVGRGQCELTQGFARRHAGSVPAGRGPGNAAGFAATWLPATPRRRARPACPRPATPPLPSRRRAGPDESPDPWCSRARRACVLATPPRRLLPPRPAAAPVRPA